MVLKGCEENNMLKKRPQVRTLKKTIALIFGIFWAMASYAQTQTITVAVAANMKDAFTEIESAFKVNHSAEIKVIYGSSGNFAAQIINGAPFHLFVSADERYPSELFKHGKTLDEGKVYAIGKLALLAKNTSGILLSNDKAELARIIAKANKIAIAKPEVAPYGKAAVEYLKSQGFWDLAKDKLVFGENISIATMYVSSGAADIGFTALSLAKSSELAKDTHFVLVDDKQYEPIRQRMVMIKGSPQLATDLFQFILSSKAKDILVKYGYSVGDR